MSVMGCRIDPSTRLDAMPRYMAQRICKLFVTFYLKLSES